MHHSFVHLCADVLRERVCFCAEGADPKDAGYVVARCMHDVGEAAVAVWVRCDVEGHGGAGAGEC